MTNESLPEMPSLEDVLNKLDDKYAPRESDEKGFAEKPPVEINYPIELDCLIKREHSETGNGEIQLLKTSIVCPYLTLYENNASFCGVIYKPCPFHRTYILKK